MILTRIFTKIFQDFDPATRRFSEEELKLESLELEPSNIQLSSSERKCDICKTGNVTKVGREAHIVLYTRSGTKKATHHEMRCNNRALPCRAGHYYGFVKDGKRRLSMKML